MTNERTTMQFDPIRRDTHTLATDAGRLPGTPGHAAAQAFLERRFAELGVEGYPGLDGYRHSFLAGSGIRMTNLVGVLRGADPSLAPILIGAHYDSVIAAPCADDNAAAVAVMLEVAARVAAEPLGRDVVVAAFDAEEPPHFLSRDMGSTRFVADALAGPVHLAVILDLVGHAVQVPGLPLDPDLMFVTGAESHPALPGVLEHLGLPTAAVAQKRVGDYSDYAAFRKAGAPYLFFSCGEWAHYHRPSDTPDRLDYVKMGRLADDLEIVLRRADGITTGYHAQFDARDFEVASMERTFGPELLTAAAAGSGLAGYRTAAELDVIVSRLRSGLRF